MENFNCLNIAKSEIIRILSKENCLSFEDIVSRFDVKYPHPLKTCLKDAVWELWGSKMVSFTDEEITKNTIICWIGENQNGI